MTDKQLPNVVFILVDNVGWGTFGVYGRMIPTPRIETGRALRRTERE
jgi:arylsulfatase